MGSNLFMEKAVVPESTLLKTRWIMLGAPLPRDTAKFWFYIGEFWTHLRRFEVEFYCGCGGYWRASSSFFKNYYINTSERLPNTLNLINH